MLHEYESSLLMLFTLLCLVSDSSPTDPGELFEACNYIETEISLMTTTASAQHTVNYVRPPGPPEEFVRCCLPRGPLECGVGRLVGFRIQDSGRVWVLLRISSLILPNRDPKHPIRSQAKPGYPHSVIFVLFGYVGTLYLQVTRTTDVHK